MPRRAVVAFAVALAVGLGVVAWRAGGSEVRQAFPVGPGPTPVAGAIPPRAELCQTPIEALADTNAVTFWVRARPGTPLEVAVRDLRGRPRARETVVARGGDPEERRIRFGRIREGETVSFCLRNRGSVPAFPSGGEQAADAGTTLDGRRSGADLTLVFLRERPRSALGVVPQMLRRAALFRFGWVGTWTLWALAALVLVAVPALCAFALARAAREPD